MKKLIVICFLLTGCAAWNKMQKEAWEKDGACSVVCDYRMNSMSTSYTIDAQHCSCYSPAAAEFNIGRLIPLDETHKVVSCAPDCKTLADTIIRRRTK